MFSYLAEVWSFGAIYVLTDESIMGCNSRTVQHAYLRFPVQLSGSANICIST